MTVGTPASGTETYAYTSGKNRLASLTNASGTRSISYGGRGNTASETRPGSASVSASYDGYGRLLSYARTGDPSQANAYNGLDERVGVTSGSTTHSFVYDPDGRLIGEYDSSGSPVAETIWLSPTVANDNEPFGGSDGVGGYAPLALVTGSGGSAAIYWVHGNHMGVPLVTTDASGAVATPTGYTVLGFPGQTRTLADLYYNRYRDYDSSLGRYIQADPIGLGGGNNPYLYAGANPLRYTDPSGKFAQALVGLCVANLEICAPAIIIGGGILCYYYCPRLPLPCPELTADDPSGPDFATSGGNGGPTKRPPPPAPNAPPGSTWAASPGAPIGPSDPDPDDDPDPNNWGRPDTLADHYARHGGDFGAKSEADYARQASEFLKNSGKNNYSVKVDSNGVIRVYDPRTNTFGSYNANGTTKTFYKPPGGMNYWLRQPGSDPLFDIGASF